MATYQGMHLWAEGVKKAGSVDRMKVIEALEAGICFDGPAASHHRPADASLRSSTSTSPR